MITRKLVAVVLLAIFVTSCGGGGGSSGSTIKASAGPDRSVVRFDSVTFDGSASLNAESYEWEQVDGPYVSIDDPAQAVQTVRFPAVGTYHFRLTARKGDLTSSDEVEVVVRERPTVVLTTPMFVSSVTGNSTLVITGRASAGVERIRAISRTNENIVDAVLDDTGLFRIDSLAVNPGDNNIVVEAYDSGGLVVEKNILITRTTAANFLNPLKLSVSDVAVGTAQDVVATVSLEEENIKGDVELVELDATGKVVRVVAKLQDNGDVTAGDEYRNDSEYSGKFSVNFSRPGNYQYRARVNGDVTDFGNIVSIKAYEPHEINDYEDALAATGRMVRNSKMDSVLPGTREHEQAKDALLRDLRSSPLVKTATMAPDRHSIDVEYDNGVANTVVFDEIMSPPDQQPRMIAQPRAGETPISPKPAVPGSFRMAMFSPIYDKTCYEAYLTDRSLEPLSLYPWEFDPLVRLIGEEGTAQNLKSGMQVGILYFFTRGALVTIDGKEVATIMAEDVTAERNALYKDDLDAGRIRAVSYLSTRLDCFTGEPIDEFGSKYLLTPKFFDYYIDRLPNTLVNIQTGQSVDDEGALTNVFLRKGAGAVLGLTEATYDTYSRGLSTTIISLLRGEDMDLGDAVKNTKEMIGENSSVFWDKVLSDKWGEEKDKSHPAELRILGGSGALAYRLSKVQIVNGSFEKGLSSWEPQEHGAQKVVSRWLRSYSRTSGWHTYSVFDTPLNPPDGGHMLMLATVGGEYAGVSQRLHISSDTSFLNIRYAVMREITESGDIDVNTVPWRNQKLSIVVETEDGVDHILGSESGRDLWFPLAHGWFNDVRCVRISDHVYAQNPNAPLCASNLTNFWTATYDMSAYRGHFVKLKILLQDDRSPVNSISDVQDVYVFVDDVYLEDKDMKPIGGQ